MSARAAWPGETAEQARESIARLVEQHLAYPVRSKDTMAVDEHRKILESIRDAARQGRFMT